jgi:protein SCO1
VRFQTPKETWHETPGICQVIFAAFRTRFLVMTTITGWRVRAWRITCARTGPLVLAVVGLVLSSQGVADAPTPTHPLAHQPVANSLGGDFTLQSVFGPVSLHTFRGKVAVVYFGYTFCPDACPTTLFTLGHALKSLTPAEASAVQPILITLDPARDTPKRLAEYAMFFYPSVIGLSGTPEQIAVVARHYGVRYAFTKVDSAGGYVVDHTSTLYVVGRDGRIASRLPHGTAPPEIVTTIRHALQTGARSG